LLPFQALWFFWQLLFAGPAQRGDLAQREFAKRSGLHVQRERAVAYAFDLFHVVANFFKHPANLAVFAFNQRDFIPRVVAFPGQLHMGRRGALRVHGAVAGLGAQLEAAPQFLNVFGLRLAGDLDQIGFRHMRCGAHEMVGQRAVIGHQQQAFAQVVQPADGIYARSRLLHQVHHRGPAFRIGDRGHIALGFVQQKINMTFCAVEQFAVNFDVVGCQVSLAAECGDHLPVHGDASLGDQLFGVATRRDSRRGNDLLQSLSGHSASGTF
jgi:hypothetical protein